MSNSTSNALASYVERARKVLQHEQRTHHQDQAIKPGGLELFVVRWADEASDACKKAGFERIESRSASPVQGPYDRGKASAAAPQSTVHVEAGMTAGHTVLTLLSADVTAVPGVGASVAAKLHNLGIRTVRDLLFYFPRE